MGIAILWIVLFHSGFEITFLPFAFIREIGYGGVDIFVFASGLGAFTSYTNSHSPSVFLKRRANKLLPVYYSFLLFWIPYMLLTSDISLSSIFGNILLIQGFSGAGHQFNWYISFLVLSYLLTPVFTDFVEHTSRKLTAIGGLVFIILCSIPFWGTETPILLFSRLPLFLLGMYCGKLCKIDYQLTKRDLFFAILTSIAGLVFLFLSFRCFSNYLWSHALYWYPFILITPGALLIISLVSKWISKIHVGRIFICGLEAIGKYSFEIYLTHIFLFDIRSQLECHHIIEHSNLTVFLSILVVIPTVIALRLAAKAINILLSKDRLYEKKNH